MTSRWIVVAACVALAAPARADSPDKLPVDTAAELLGGRLVVKLPKAMKLEPRGHDIMSADASPEEETRAVLNLGKARFVMMTSEELATVGTDFKAQVATQVDKTAKLEAVAVAKPLVAYAFAPTPTTDQDANLVYTSWIAHPDGTVQLVAFYVNNDGAREAAAAWTTLARKSRARSCPASGCSRSAPASASSSR